MCRYNGAIYAYSSFFQVHLQNVSFLSCFRVGYVFLMISKFFIFITIWDSIKTVALTISGLKIGVTKCIFNEGV